MNKYSVVTEQLGSLNTEIVEADDFYEEAGGLVFNVSGARRAWFSLKHVVHVTRVEEK